MVHGCVAEALRGVDRVRLEGWGAGAAGVIGGGLDEATGEAATAPGARDEKQVTDQTGASSTGARVRERARREYAARGSRAIQPTGSPPA